MADDSTAASVTPIDADALIRGAQIAVPPVAPAQASGRIHMTADGVAVHMLAPGEAVPAGALRMTRTQYEDATQRITWDHDDPQGRFKKGQAIGLREYLRRQSDGGKDTVRHGQ